MELSRSELDIDLESGGNTTEEDESKDQGFHGIEYAKGYFSTEQSSFVGLNTRGVDCMISPDDASSSGPDTDESLETFAGKLGDEMVNALEKKMAYEKRRKPNSKNPSKPPRPPKGPSIDSKNPSKPPRPPKGPSIGTADMMMMKEMSELAVLKRKRIERMKNLKTKKASSCDINLCAMIFTILFFFVIIFQGLLGSRVDTK